MSNVEQIANDEQNKKSTNEYIKTYSSESRLFGIALQNNKTDLVLASSTMNTTSKNYIEIAKISKESGQFAKTASIESEYPLSKIMFSPSDSNSELMISTSDCLQVYRYKEDKISLVAKLLSKSKVYCGPLTSCDWSQVNPAIVGVSSIDTTCGLWDINKLESIKLIIAQDKEAYDISLGLSEYTFIATGADGSVRLLDTRSNETSIIFETSDKKPIIAVDWNLMNTNFILAVGLDKKNVYVLDHRNTNSLYAIFKEHTNVVNNATWCPNSYSCLCSVGDDQRALIWNINSENQLPEKPIMSYTANAEIENVIWENPMDDWIGITYGNSAEILKIK